MNRNLLGALLLSALSLSLPACAGQPEDAPLNESASVSLTGMTLTLQDQNGHCSLRKDDGSLLSLEIPWPCAFSQDRHGQPRVEKFNQGSEIVIVYHAVPEPAPSQACDTRFQAVRLMKGQLEASMVARNAMCMKGVIDQKNFVALFDW
ncbi:hypothetical protein [uncultured Pseudomonas sp.]|uniref:hypothetical protein n=1 Tax=uncultured Pseudomonas sp. TaxID=114707 RepID=UPI0025F392E8|nr:hypothetical protein [uncultured Pseudomonas sp.]